MNSNRPPFADDTGPQPIFVPDHPLRYEDSNSPPAERAISFIGRTWQRFIDTQPYFTGYALARFVTSASAILWGLVVLFEQNGIAYQSARGLRALGVNEDLIGSTVLAVGAVQFIRLLARDVPRDWEYIANGLLFLFWTYSLLGTFMYAAPPNALGVATTPFIWWFAWWNMFARPR